MPKRRRPQKKVEPLNIQDDRGIAPLGPGPIPMPQTVPNFDPIYYIWIKDMNLCLMADDCPSDIRNIVDEFKTRVWEFKDLTANKSPLLPEIIAIKAYSMDQAGYPIIHEFTQHGSYFVAWRTEPVKKEETKDA